MPLRFILRYLANNQQLIEKLAESYPIRRAAQLTAYAFHKSKDVGEDVIEKLKESQATTTIKEESKQIGQRFQSFQRRLSEEIKDGFKDMNEEIKKKNCGSCTKTRITETLDNPPHERTHSVQDIIVDIRKGFKMTDMDTAMKGVFNINDVDADPDSYDFLLVIGKGCFESASVHLAKHKESKTLLAIKRVLLDKVVVDLPMIQHELMFHRTLRHPNLLPSVKSSFVTGSELWTIFPLMGYGSCRDLLHAHFMEGLPEQAVAIIVHEVLNGLQYMHARAMIHRAVKASHVLVSHTGHVALSGFHHVLPMMKDGKRVRKVHDFPNKHYIGCLNWASPELLEQNLAGYDTRSDIYSVGILACELANGVVPFADMPFSQMLLEKMEGTTPRLLDSTTLAPLEDAELIQDPTLPYQRTFSQHFHGIVEACLQTQPQVRPTANTLIQHSFFRSVRRGKQSNTLFPNSADTSLLPDLLKPVAPLNMMDLKELTKHENNPGKETGIPSLAVEEVTDDIAQISVDDWEF